MIFPTVSVFDDTAASSFVGPHGGNLEGTEDDIQGIIPIDCVLKQFFIVSRASPGAGNSRTYTVRKNGVDTAFSITENASDTSGFSFQSVSFSKGDTVAIKQVRSGTPTGTKHRSRLIWKTDNNEFFMMGSAGDILNLTSYAQLAGDLATQCEVVEFNSEILVPGSFTVKNLHVYLRNDPNTGNSRVFTMLKNGAAQGTTVTFSNMEQGTKSDTANSFSVAAGDSINLKVTFTGTPDATPVRYSIAFVATNKGQFFWANCIAANTHVSNAERFVCQGILPFFSTSELVHQEYAGPHILWTSLWVEINVTLPILVSRTTTFRVGSVSSALSVNISSGNSIGHDDDIVNTVPGDLVNMITQGSGGAGATPVLHTGILAQVKALQDPILGGGVTPFRRTT